MKHQVLLSLVVVCGTLVALSPAPAVASDGGAWAHTGSLNVARECHTATLLSDGRVLVAGGGGQGQPYHNSAEVYDPTTELWINTGTMHTRRMYHTATLLIDGRVLVAGGYNANGGVRETAELWNPVTGQWTFTGSLHVPREYHTATLLPDGRVLVVGGLDANWDPLASTELYDPLTKVWTNTGELNQARRMHSATLLPDGRVLVAGGTGTVPGSAEVYDPAAGQWSLTGGLNNLGWGQAVLLPTGRVLLTDGDSAELYDPVAGQWTITDGLNTHRSSFAISVLSDGRALAAGGYWEGYLVSAEVYDPSAGQWTFTGSMSETRANTTLTLLNDGRVLAAGGRNAWNTAELWSAAPEPELSLHLNALKLNWKRARVPGTYLLNAAVRIHGLDHGPVPGATAYGDWALPDGTTQHSSALTNGAGVAKLNLKSRQPGTHQFCVVNVTKDGYVYNPGANEQPACKSVVTRP